MVEPHPPGKTVDLYYHDHKQEIEEEFRKEDDLYEWVKTNIPSKIPPELREKFGGRAG